MNFRKHFGYDLEEASNEATIPADMQGESLTIQSMAEDADINVMMARFGVTGKMPENVRTPTYGDFSGINDFQSAMNAITEAQEAFMELPASLRARFENNPQRLLEFVSNNDNIPEARKLGLLKENTDGNTESRPSTNRSSSADGTTSPSRESLPGSTRPAPSETPT